MYSGFFESCSFPCVIITVPDNKGMSSVISINAAFEKLSGYSSQDVIGHSPVLLDQLQFSAEDLHNGMDGEKECIHKDGSIIWVYYSLFAIKEIDQVITSFGIILFDITSKKQLDNQYKHLNDQFLNLVQNIPGTIYRCALDEHWTIMFLSDHIYELSGYPVSDFMDNKVRSYASIIHPDDTNMVDQTVQKAVAEKKPYTIEYRIIHANGDVRYVYERGKATFNEYEVSHLDGFITDITDKKLHEKEIAHLAFYDPLTHLPNRRLLIDRLNQAQLSSQRNQRFAAVMFIDLDNFKELNDTFGHDYGDILLQQVADRLSSIIRKEDTVARLGGDEFIILLKDLSDCLDDAMKEVINIANKLIHVLNAPYLLKLIEYKCTPSIGITFIQGKEYDQDELIKQADRAMYDAKKSGRNTYRFFNR